MKKAIYIGSSAGKEATVEERFEVIKAAGFDGVEVPTVSDAGELAKLKKLSESTGVEIHGIMNSSHWKFPLSSPEASVREKSKEGMRTSLGNAAELGASAVLLVPAVVNEEVSYEDAMKRSREGIEDLLKTAEELKVVIAVENVWNKFLLSPIEFAEYVDSFESDYLKAYFDVGNILLYGYPEQWIRTLGKRMVKVHLKDFRVSDRSFVYLLQGNVNWKAVMTALKEVGYDDYLTAELFPPYPTCPTQTAYDASVHMDKIMGLA